MVVPSGGNLEMKKGEIEISEKQTDPNGETCNMIEEDDETRNVGTQSIEHNRLELIISPNDGFKDEDDDESCPRWRRTLGSREWRIPRT